MIVISEDDIEKVVNPAELIGAIEKAYRIQDKESTLIPDRVHLDYNKNTLLLMPGFTESAFGTKLVSVFPENSKLGKPALHGIMVLNDPETGEPTALLNGSKLTAIRTGAVGATAIKYLANKSARTLGIIGAGAQAYHQAIFAVAQRDFYKLIICDKHINKAESLKSKLEPDIENLRIEVTNDPNSLVVESDVIITATSSSVPVFDLDTAKLTDKTFIGIGSYKPNMQEFPLSLFEILDKVYVDTIFAKEESGDIKIPMENGILKEENIIPFNSLVLGQEKRSTSSVNLFKSVGMALFDLTAAELIYRKAKEKGIGTETSL